MRELKKKSLAALADNMKRYDDSRNPVKQSDFTSLQTFISAYLNTPDKKQRKKLAEEFRKRHMELYTFIKDNAELIAAETEMTRINKMIGEFEAEVQTSQKFADILNQMGGEALEE